MRRMTLLAVLAVGLALALGTMPASAQDILGLSMRPMDEMPAGTARGTVDIILESGGSYAVTVDLSPASENLNLATFDDATAFVVWAIDTDGVRHSVGTLDDNLVLGDSVDYQIARLAVTAEANPAATSPTGSDLFVATLRNVQEQGGSTTQQEATKEPTLAAAAEATAAAAPTTAASPKELPTTGNTLPDVLAVAAVAAALLLIGLRLRGVRV